MSDNLSMTHLRTFLSVATLGSFRKTAELMNTTQPAISSRIAKLEAILNTKLFNRDTGRIQLTESGEALKPHAETMIKIADSLVDYIKGNQPTNGTMRIGVTEFAVKTWLPAFMANLKTVFPGLDIALTVDKSWNIKQSLLQKELDIAFLLGPVADERIQGIKYATYEYCWVASPKIGLLPHNLHSIKKISERYSIITDSRRSLTHQELLDYLHSIDVANPKILPCISMTSIADLAIQGAGVALLPKRLAGFVIKEEKLCVLMTDWTPTPMHFSGAYLDGPDAQLAERLIHYVKSLL